ncbi:histidine kinase [Zoogloea sp.]|uniref:histidine kinase n=1 Tax=Zoogloea sp. TaxID=49181 RepID=UPI0035B24C1F
METHDSRPAGAVDEGHERSVDLKRTLLQRVSLFAVAIGLVASAVVLQRAEARMRAHIERAGGAVERLLASEAAQPRDVFRRSLDGLDLSSLDGIGPLLGICVAVEDIYKRPAVRRCFGDGAEAPALLRGLLATLTGPDIAFRGVIGQYPGVKVGEFVVTPNVDSEANAVWDQIRTVLGMTIGILVLNLLVYLPVRRALGPAQEILAVLGRLQAGDLAARMPRPQLVELRLIASGFDHLVVRLQQTLAGQRQLALRLLTVREEERRHLARELHDEFGQCLASIGAEAAYVSAAVQNSRPDLLPAAQAIASVTGHMMESLQGILHQLRPVGLEEFGLEAALEQLLAGGRRRRPDCAFTLDIDGAVDDLPDGLTVSLYRIVQESLTNALRHGEPQMVAVRLQRDAAGCRLWVEDDGAPRKGDTAGSGLGVLGMHERVEALGGRFALEPVTPRGMRVSAIFPPDACHEEDAVHV